MVERAELDAECDVFCRYLTGAAIDEYVREKYAAAHECGAVELPDTTRFERAVVAIAHTAPWLAHAMDSYSRLFGNGHLLRRKLVVLLAILETRSPPADRIDAPTAGSNFGMFLRMGWLACGFAVRVALSALFLIPVRVYCALGGGR